MNRTAKAAIALCSLVLASGIAAAADADLDLRFGGTGSVALSQFPAADALARGVALLRDAQGRTLALVTVVDPFSGSAENSLDLLIYRLEANGSLDTTFNFGQGYYLQNLDWLDIAAAALDSQGRIVLAGTKLSEPPGQVAALLALRLLPTGARDLPFGTDGITGAAFAFGTTADRATAVAIGANDEVYLAGTVTGANPNWFAFKFNATDGTPVSNWGAGLGFQIVDFQQGSSLDALAAVTVTSNGRLVLLGQACGNAGSCRPAAARLTTTGALDPTFCASAGCIASSPTGIKAGRRILRDLAVAGFSVASGEIATGLSTAGGKLLLAGRVLSTDLGTNARALVVRLGSDGDLDDSFGDAGNPGVQTLSVTDAPLATRAVALDPNGRVVLAGTATRNALRRIFVARLLASGALDSSFASGAALAEYFAQPASDDRSVAGLLTGPGRITAIGDYAGPVDRDAFVFRLSDVLFDDGFE